MINCLTRAHGWDYIGMQVDTLYKLISRRGQNAASSERFFYAYSALKFPLWERIPGKVNVLANRKAAVSEVCLLGVNLNVEISGFATTINRLTPIGSRSPKSETLP